MIKKYPAVKSICLSSLCLLLSCSSGNREPVELNIIPTPNKIEFTDKFHYSEGQFQFVFIDEDLRKLVDVFESQLPERIELLEDAGTRVWLGLNESFAAEQYMIAVNKKGIRIEGGSPHGVFNGLQTLLNILLFSEYDGDRLKIPCCEIDDSPRFHWRGLMLDESRHFFGMEKVKQILDLMALHKLNTFHWHLTDEPGWRIEIEKYPRLAEIGGKGNYHDPDAPARYYTREQIKEVVQYAADRYIKIIPEIDMPGHAAAANRAYPEFSGGGSKTHPEWTFNPGKEGTFEYLTDILREVETLFQAPYIHIGGDEVSYGNEGWKSNREVVKLMEDRGLKDLKEVERYFVNRMADTIKAMERVVIGWDEIVEAGVSGDKVISMWWRHNKPEFLFKSLDSGYRVVLCPRNPLYFDFVQDSLNHWGRQLQGAVVDLENVHNYPPDSVPEISQANKNVLGIQANIWTERIQNGKRLDYMTYPRLQALAEAAWTRAENKDFANFKERIRVIYRYLDAENVYYYNVFDPASTPEPEGIPKKMRW